jgi:peroxiredoxin
MNPMDDPPPAKTPAPTELGPGLHDFTLPNAQGGPATQLSSYIGKKNVVMVFYRAFW